jgi:hypothetical protein
VVLLTLSSKRSTPGPEGTTHVEVNVGLDDSIDLERQFAAAIAGH